MGRCELFMGGCKRFMDRYGTVWVVVTFLWVGVARSGSVWLGLGQGGKRYNQYGNVYGSAHERVMRCIVYP